MATDAETIKRISGLSALSIKDDELDGFAKDLDMIIGCMEQLMSIETDDIKPMEHVLPLCNVLREDVCINENRREELIKSAVVEENGCYKVPSVVESL